VLISQDERRIEIRRRTGHEWISEIRGAGEGRLGALAIFSPTPSYQSTAKKLGEADLPFLLQ
jgi:hypothetical protein